MGLPRQDNNINFPAFCKLHLQSDFALNIPGSRLDPLPRHFMYGTFPKYPLYYPLAGLMFSHPQFTHRLPSAIPGSNVSSVQPKAQKLYDEAPQRRNLQKHGGEFHGTRSKTAWSFFLLGSLAVVVVVVMGVTVN